MQPGLHVCNSVWPHVRPEKETTRHAPQAGCGVHAPHAAHARSAGAPSAALGERDSGCGVEAGVECSVPWRLSLSLCAHAPDG
eukprot:11838737-Alexandrium_andersonii.AAC.1